VIGSECISITWVVCGLPKSQDDSASLWTRLRIRLTCAGCHTPIRPDGSGRTKRALAATHPYALTAAVRPTDCTRACVRVRVACVLALLTPENSGDPRKILGSGSA
jgi:hypothetical protein